MNPIFYNGHLFKAKFAIGKLVLMSTARTSKHATISSNNMIYKRETAKFIRAFLSEIEKVFPAFDTCQMTS